MQRRGWLKRVGAACRVFATLAFIAIFSLSNLSQSNIFTLGLLTNIEVEAAEEKQALPESIIVLPENPKLLISVSVDKPAYLPGELIKISFDVSKDAYVYIYGIDTKGNVTLLFPNGFSPDNFVKAGKHILPEAKGGYGLVIEGPPGNEYVQAIASLRSVSVLEGEFTKKAPFLPLSSNPKSFRQEVEEWLGEAIPAEELAVAWTGFKVLGTGELLIQSVPPGAIVYVDDKPLGTTSAREEKTIKVVEGIHRVKLVKSCYSDWEEAVTVPLGRMVEVTARLEQILDCTGMLLISSTPPGAEIYLDGEFVGWAWRTLTIKAKEGQHTVEVVKEGYAIWSIEVAVKFEQETSISATLTPIGRLLIRADPPGAKIYVDGRARAETLSNQAIELEVPSGSRQVQLVRCGYKRWSQTVYVPPTQAGEITAQLEQITELFIESDPSGAEIYLNGEYQGETPEQVEIEPTDQITLTKAGYRKWSTNCITQDKLEVRLAKLSPPPEPIELKPYFRVGLNAGMNSIGSDAGLIRGLNFGISISFTADKIPEYIEVEESQAWENEDIYNFGPAVEFYGQYSLPLLNLISLHTGIGVTLQNELHINRPAASSEAINPEKITIKPHGYRELKSHITTLGGLSLKITGVLVSGTYHDRRGLVVGISWEF